jgi:hypothetical protein
LNVNLYHFLPLILALNLVIGSAYNPSYSQEPVKLYSNGSLGLTLEYPPDWSINDNSSSYNSTSEFQIFFVPDGGSNTNTLIDFSIMGIGNYSLDNYSKFSQGLYENNTDIQDMKANISSNKLGNIDSPTLNMTYTVIDEASARQYVQEISTISNQTLYAVTLVAPENDVTEYLPSLLAITSSIRIS